MQVYYSLLGYHKGKIKNRVKPKARGKALQHPQSPQLIHPRNCAMPQSMQKGMHIFSGTRETILQKTPQHQAENSRGAARRGGVQQD
jgi:hypothetical protein